MDVPITNVSFLSESCWDFHLPALSGNELCRLTRLHGHQMEENTFQVCSLTASWEDLSHSSEAKKRGTTDYFGYLPPLSQTIMCSFKGAFHPKLLPGLQSSAVTSFPFLFPSRCNSPDARAVFASWSCSALQPGPLNKMTPCSLFKPQLFCTAPGTDVCFRALELNSSAPSLWNHLTSHPSDLASSLPTS